MSRVELLWRTILGRMKACFAQLADWTEERLPNGIGLLLVLFMRTVLLVEMEPVPLLSKDQDAAKQQGAVFSPDTYSEDISLYITRFEDCLTRILALEPESAPYLPRSGDFTEMCSSVMNGRTDVQCLEKLLLQRSIEDQETLRDRSRQLGLDLPMPFTQLSNVEIGFGITDGKVKHTLNWIYGFLNGFNVLEDAATFRTNQHDLGLAKCAMKPGDQLWILDGAYTPFCLRKLPNGKHQFLGEVYIHEIMDGEAVKYCQDPVQITLQ